MPDDVSTVAPAFGEPDAIENLDSILSSLETEGAQDWLDAGASSVSFVSESLIFRGASCSRFSWSSARCGETIPASVPAGRGPTQTCFQSSVDVCLLPSRGCCVCFGGLGAESISASPFVEPLGSSPCLRDAQASSNCVICQTIGLLFQALESVNVGDERGLRQSV